MEERASLISIKNLKKSFGSLKVLDGVNLNIKLGENLAVLGKEAWKFGSSIGTLVSTR